MSPTVRRDAGYRFFFFRARSRGRTYTFSTTGEAKFWLYPEIQVAQNRGLSDRRLNTALRLAREHADEIRQAWQTHFGS